MFDRRPTGASRQKNPSRISDMDEDDVDDTVSREMMDKMRPFAMVLPDLAASLPICKTGRRASGKAVIPRHSNKRSEG
jgi:L-2-hydroxyglutarate oxidase LhgO